MFTLKYTSVSLNVIFSDRNGTLMLGVGNIFRCEEHECMFGEKPEKLSSRIEKDRLELDLTPDFEETGFKQHQSLIAT
jgi:hypothetical protein